MCGSERGITFGFREIKKKIIGFGTQSRRLVKKFMCETVPSNR